MNRKVLEPPRQGSVSREKAKEAVKIVNMNNEYKEWKKSVDLSPYIQEAIEDCGMQTIELYEGVLSPSQWKKVVSARAMELAHTYEGWSD